MEERPLASLEFRNLPLLEVALRVYPANPMGPLSLGLLAELQQSLKDEFPRSEPLQVSEISPEDVGKSFSIFPGSFPAIEFGRAVPGEIVRLQNDFLMCAWQKSRNSDAAPYPRYPRLRATLERVSGLVSKMVGQDVFEKARVVNMTYVNFMERRADDGGNVLNRILDKRMVGDAASGAVRVHQWVLNYQTDGGIDRHLEVQGVSIGEPDARIEGHLLKSVAGIRLEPVANSLEALDRVHGDLQGFFASSLSDEAKHLWGLVDN